MALAEKGISRIKMSVMIPGTKQENPVWYSPIKHNKKSDREIIDAMKIAFKKNKPEFAAKACWYYFYNGLNDDEFITRERP